VKLVAFAMALGTTREGSLASSAILLLLMSGHLSLHSMLLPGGTIGARHNPCRRQAAEKEGKSWWTPTRSRLKVREGIPDTVLILLLGQKSRTRAYQDTTVEDDVAARQPRQPQGRQGVDQCVENREEGHDCHDVPCVGDKGEVGNNGDGRKKHLAGSIFRGCAPSDSSNKVNVPYAPSARSHNTKILRDKILPAIQHKNATWSSGARNFNVKYIAPELG
jgi:hypothetical protein